MYWSVGKMLRYGRVKLIFINLLLILGVVEVGQMEDRRVCLIGQSFTLDEELYCVMYQMKSGTCVCESDEDSLVLSYGTVKRYIDNGDNFSLDVE